MTSSPEGRQEAPVLDVNGLLPCPFCGSKAGLQYMSGWEPGTADISTASVHCTGCFTSQGYAYTENAKAAWNRRALIPAKPAVEVVEALRSKAKKSIGELVEMHKRILIAMEANDQMLFQPLNIWSDAVLDAMIVIGDLVAALQAPATPDAQTEVEK